MARKTHDWKLGVKGPSHVEGRAKGSLPLGLGVRHYCQDNNVAPGSKLLRAANNIAIERGNRLVWLEDLMSALDVPIKEVGDTAKKLRGKQARTRYKSDRVARDEALEQKRADRRQKAADRKAAKQPTAETAAAA